MIWRHYEMQNRWQERGKKKALRPRLPYSQFRINLQKSTTIFCFARRDNVDFGCGLRPFLRILGVLTEAPSSGLPPNCSVLLAKMKWILVADCVGFYVFLMFCEAPSSGLPANCFAIRSLPRGI
jgi:hypothetical protein